MIEHQIKRTESPIHVLSSQFLIQAIYFQSLLCELIEKYFCVSIFNDNPSEKKLSFHPIFDNSRNP